MTALNNRFLMDLGEHQCFSGNHMVENAGGLRVGLPRRGMDRRGDSELLLDADSCLVIFFQ